MNKLLKTLFIIILIIVFLSAFSSSYTSLSIDHIASVVAMGIDVSDSNNLRVSFQFTNASSVSESGTTGQSPSSIYTIDASSISSAINLMNSYIGKELNLSHCKLISLSEELASKGISEVIYTLINESQVRPTTNIVITRCSAKFYLENSKPLFENLLTKYYEVFANSSHYTGYTSNATLGDFFNSLVCNACEPYAILGGINSEKKESPTSINPEKDSSSMSSESSLSGQMGTENIGLAVFKDDYLVGELNSIETLSFLATRNDVNGFLVSIPDPQNQDSYIDIYLTPYRSTSTNVKIVNGSPYISLKYYFSGRIQSMKEDSNYLSSETLTTISNYCNSYLESIFNSYLYKTSKELNSDINGFGKIAKSNFITTKDFEDYNWLEKYKDSFFDVKVETSVKSGFLLSDT